MWSSYLIVGAGGALGAMARFALMRNLEASLGAIWPIALINVAGSALLGAWFLGLPAGSSDAPSLRLLLGVGVLGGFTTFSAFSVGALSLWQSQGAGSALVFVLANVLGCVGAAALGGFLVRAAVA